MKYDVIIVGSGLGGLACAHILSRQGLSVLVLERGVQPGGCMQSYPRRDVSAPKGTKPVWYDTGLHHVGGLAEGQALHDSFEQLNLLKLPWQRLDANGFNRIRIDGRDFSLMEGFDAFVEGLSRDFPTERKGLETYVNMLKKSLEAVDLESAASLFDTGAWNFMNQTFHDPLLIDVLSATSQNLELRKETLPLFVFAHANASYIQSSWRLRGDGNMLVRSLVDDIKHYGGELICRADVEELIERDGMIVGARCTNGEVYEGRYYISNAHPAITCDMLKNSNAIRPFYRKRIMNAENTRGMLTVSLRMKPETLRYFNYNQFIYRDCDVWETAKLDESEQQHINGIMINCRAPEQGEWTEVIDLLTSMTWKYCEPWADTYIGHRGEDYQQMKDRLAKECIALAEEMLPGLSDMVAECYVSTPLTYRDYTLTPFGSAYGIRKDYRNSLLCMIPPYTSINNLMLTGQNLIMHGVEGVTKTAFRTSNLLLTKYQQDNI